MKQRQLTFQQRGLELSKVIGPPPNLPSSLAYENDLSVSTQQLERARLDRCRTPLALLPVQVPLVAT